MIVTRRHEWDMAHRLPNHDGKCRRLHGHRYVAEIDVTGPVTPSGPAAGPVAGMVVDFGEVQRLIDKTIGDWDHRCMLHVDDQFLSDYQGPAQDLYGVFRVPFVPTAENIALETLTRLRREGLNVTRVRIYETPDGWAEARYEGLKDTHYEGQ